MKSPTPNQFAAQLEQWRQAKQYHSEPAPESLIQVLRSCIKEYGIKEIRKHTSISATLYQRAKDESPITSKKAIRKTSSKIKHDDQTSTTFAKVEAINPTQLVYDHVHKKSSKSITITNANGVSLKIDGYDNAENLVKIFLSNEGSL